MRHHHWLYGYWPQPINGLYQCKTKQISPATPDLISIIHQGSWCDLITPRSSYLFPINIHRSGAFSIEPSSSEQRAPARVFSPHFHWNWVVMNILRPGSEVSHRVPLSLTCRHSARPGETMPTLSTNERRAFGSRDFCRPMRERDGGEPIRGRIQHTDWIVRILECTAGIFDISIMLLMIHQEIITNS